MNQEVKFKTKDYNYYNRAVGIIRQGDLFLIMCVIESCLVSLGMVMVTVTSFHAPPLDGTFCRVTYCLVLLFFMYVASSTVSVSERYLLVYTYCAPLVTETWVGSHFAPPLVFAESFTSTALPENPAIVSLVNIKAEGGISFLSLSLACLTL